jgi:hypothetical protein
MPSATGDGSLVPRAECSILLVMRDTPRRRWQRLQLTFVSFWTLYRCPVSTGFTLPSTKLCRIHFHEVPPHLNRGLHKGPTIKPNKPDRLSPCPLLLEFALAGGLTAAMRDDQIPQSLQ